VTVCSGGALADEISWSVRPGMITGCNFRRTKRPGHIEDFTLKIRASGGTRDIHVWAAHNRETQPWSQPRYGSSDCFEADTSDHYASMTAEIFN